MSLIAAFLLSLLVPLLPGFSSVSPAGGTDQTTVAEPSPKDAPRTPPPLSLETLFHPEKRFDYDGELPEAKWIEGDSPLLIVKRGETWKTVDLESGREQPWDVVETLAGQLGRLEGIGEPEAKKVAARVAGDLKRPDEVKVVRLGKPLAIVSTQTPARWLTRDASMWENTTLDPSARRVAYTTEGDLYVRDVGSGLTMRLTDDGTETLLDGILDWTYQEEIYGRGNYRGFWFSHDGDWLAMLRIDISELKPYVLTGAASDRGEALTRRYSKAGDPIPHASLFLWDLRRVAEGYVPPPRKIDQSTPAQERIITGVWWHPRRNQLLYAISDRLQTWRELRSLDEAFVTRQSGEVQRWLREESPAWVEPPTAPSFLPEGDLIWRSDLPSGRARLYRISERGSVVTPLTPDGFDVADHFLAPEGDWLLVTGDLETGTVERHAYRIELAPTIGGTVSETARDDASPRLAMERMTPDAGWHAVQVSPEGTAMLVEHSTPGEPPSLTVRPLDGEDFPPIELAPGELKVPGGVITPEMFRIETEDGVPLPAMLYLPEQASADKRCPVIIETYGGPQAPVVTARWGGTRALYRTLLARRGVATLVVDNRSSAGRGIADTWSIRHRVGEVEMKDVRTVTDWLAEQPWADPKRVAIRGWSFGGFLTLYAMTHSDAFVAGVAGGSVTDWKEYDSFYTERYMGLPAENEAGYRETAPVEAAADLSGHVLLIHGELDDNVHPSNTLRMAAALQAAGKQFDLMIYPGAAHGITDPKQAWHLAELTDRFLMDQLSVAGGRD